MFDAMQTQPDKPGRGPEKRVEEEKTVDNSFGTCNSSVQVIPQSLLFHDVQHVNVRKENEAVDMMFEAFLSKANRKLLGRADQAMSEQKRSRSSSRTAREAGYLC